MNHSIVRWLTIPDTWDFTDDIIEENPISPEEESNSSGYSIATWFTDEDIWNHEFEEIFSNVLIKIDNSYFTYEDEEFLEIEPTEENFKKHSVNLMELVTPNEKGIKPIMTLDEVEIVHLTDKENPKLNIKGFKDLRPIMESSNPRLLIHSGSEDIKPIIHVKHKPKPQLILPNGDIKLRMMDKIHEFTLYSNTNNNGDIKVIFSTDSGKTWHSYRDEELIEININKLSEVKEKGLTPDEFNQIKENWNKIIQDKEIRFAYYLEIEDFNSIAEVDQLDVKMDMYGRWRKVKEDDYTYSYDNEHIYVEFFKDGSYKVNYQE